jgi:hypothetical protein
MIFEVRMPRRATWAGVFVFALFATPLHLAVEAHEFHHENGDDHEHRHDSEREPHPAVDHELTALAKAPRFVPPVVDVAVFHEGFLPPDVRAWVPLIEAEIRAPSGLFASPPRSPRSPPL